MDRFEPPWLGRRRGWLVADAARAGRGAGLDGGDAAGAALGAFALLAGLVAFLSASQDVVVDAYRTDVLLAGERGLGSSLTVLGYRLAMILSGGIAFIWVDPQQGGGWSWPEVYRLMAGLMVGCGRRLGAAAAAAARRRRARRASRATTCSAFSPSLRRSRLGFVVTDRVFSPLARAGLAPLFEGTTCRGRCSCAGPTWPRSSPASPSPCRWRRGRRGGRASRPCSAAWPATSPSRARPPSSPSSSSTSCPTPSRARC